MRSATSTSVAAGGSDVVMTGDKNDMALNFFEHSVEHVMSIVAM